MKTDLYRVFEYYLSRNKIINKTEVKNLIKLILFDRNLLDLVKNITTLEYEPSYYSYSNKTININISKIIKDTKYEDKELFKDIFSKIQTYQKYNLNILKCILHEIEHVRQYRLYDNKTNSLESKLIYMSFNIYYNYDLTDEEKEIIENKIEQEYYKLDTFYYSEPTERMAFINSALEIVGIAKKICLDENIKELYLLDILEYEDSEYEISNNGKVICPLKKYIKIENNILNKKGEVCYEEYFRSIMNRKSNMSLSKRMKYGLPITKAEYLLHNEKMENNKIIKLIRKYNS